MTLNKNPDHLVKKGKLTTAFSRSWCWFGPPAWTEASADLLEGGDCMPVGGADFKRLGGGVKTKFLHRQGQGPRETWSAIITPCPPPRRQHSCRHVKKDEELELRKFYTQYKKKSPPEISKILFYVIKWSAEPSRRPKDLLRKKGN